MLSSVFRSFRLLANLGEGGEKNATFDSFGIPMQKSCILKMGYRAAYFQGPLLYAVGYLTDLFEGIPVVSHCRVISWGAAGGSTYFSVNRVWDIGMSPSGKSSSTHSLGMPLPLRGLSRQEPTLPFAAELLL
ncbi:UNVERIFIED_CONTAM: hypothetical protein Sindi_1815600 [Sesamum indicum]